MVFTDVEWIVTLVVVMIMAYVIYIDYFNKYDNFSNTSLFKLTKPKNVLQIYKLLYILDKILRKNDIEYWIDGGTLLGAIRHKGLIPWDDDGDVQMWDIDEDKLMSLRSEFEKYGVILMNTWFGYKIFFKTGTIIKGYKWRYPAIDIFPVKYDNDRTVYSYPRAQKYYGHRCYYNVDNMYPFEKYKFGSFELPGVSSHEAENYLDRCYKEDWPNYAYQMFDHENEKSHNKSKIKVRLTSEERIPAMPIEFDKF